MCEGRFGLKALPRAAGLDAGVGLCLGADQVIAPVPDLVIAVVKTGELHKVFSPARTLIAHAKHHSFASEGLPRLLGDCSEKGPCQRLGCFLLLVRLVEVEEGNLEGFLVEFLVTGEEDCEDGILARPAECEVDEPAVWQTRVPAYVLGACREHNVWAGHELRDVACRDPLVDDGIDDPDHEQEQHGQAHHAAVASRHKGKDQPCECPDGGDWKQENEFVEAG